MVYYGHLGLDLDDTLAEAKADIQARLQRVDVQRLSFYCDVLGGAPERGWVVSRSLFEYLCSLPQASDVCVIWNMDPGVRPAMSRIMGNKIPGNPALIFLRQKNIISLPPDDVDLQALVVLVPPDHVREWRILTILEDGRRVYFSHRGRIEYQSKTKLEKTNLALASIGVYSPDLMNYGSKEEVLKQAGGSNVVRVVSVQVAHKSQAIDQSAFLLGGLPVQQQ